MPINSNFNQEPYLH